MSELKLKRCDISKCEAMCCHDGVWLSEEDLTRIREAQALEDASMISKGNEISTQRWSDGKLYPKTAVRPFNYSNPDWPSHFPKTRCIFADEKGLCELELLARRRGENPWRYKPQACWLHPLVEKDGNLQPPPLYKKEDPYNCGPDYPGFSTYTPCGEHQEDGEKWNKVLFKELQEHQMRSKKPTK